MNATMPARMARTSGEHARKARPIILVFSFLALLFGLVAVTAEPVPIALAVAMLVGAALLARPVWLIWILLAGGLLIVGVLPIWAEGAAAKTVWAISAIGFALLFLSLFVAVTQRDSIRGTPTFVWAALAFIVWSVFHTAVRLPDAYEALSGFKRYFQATGLLFALAWLPITEKDVGRWRKLVLIVALLQLPWALYELIRLVPIREGLVYAYPGLVPIDVVAGTFGADMTRGGANAEMATFLIIVLAFLLARLREKVIAMRIVLWLSPFVLAPLFMGETKVVVILLPLLFLTLYRRELLARPHYALAGLVFCILLTVAAGYAYVEISKKPLDKLVNETVSYNFYEKGHGLNKLNRTRVLTFWAERQGIEDPAGTLIGHGLGAAHDSTSGQIAHRYPGYGIGLTAISLLLWEQGVLGTLLFLSTLAFAWRAAGRLQRWGAPHWVKADAAAIQASLPLFALYFFYRSTLLELMSFQIVFWGLLGYLAWLVRRYDGNGRRA